MRLCLAVYVSIIAYSYSPKDAIAADMSWMPAGAPSFAEPASANWTGLYFGAHIGGAWDHTGGYSTSPCPCTSADGTITGQLGGLQAGYNYQIGSFVMGAEADVTRVGLRGSYSALSGVDELSSSVDYYGTATARLGAVLDRAMIYVKGGVAATHSTHSDFNSLESETFTTNYLKLGGAFGAGIEYALTPNWSIKLEYDFIDTGTKPATFIAASGDLFMANMYQRINVIGLGANYRF